MSPFVRSLAPGAVGAAVGLAAVIPFLLWGNEKAPEFYGAFMAAIVAAIAVVLGAYYQAELTRRRDDALAREERIAEAIDLYLWIEHAIGEMEFIGEMLKRFRERLKEGGADSPDLPLERYREVVSSKFMEELRDRAKIGGKAFSGGRSACSTHAIRHISGRGPSLSISRCFARRKARSQPDRVAHLHYKRADREAEQGTRRGCLFPREKWPCPDHI